METKECSGMRFDTAKAERDGDGFVVRCFLAGRLTGRFGNLTRDEAIEFLDRLGEPDEIDRLLTLR